MTAPEQPRRLGLWITLAAALVYCLWLGVHWLPLNWSDKELAASASRVWDIKREIVEHHHLPWWTPNFMSGSSYALNYSRGFYLVPWILFTTITDLESSGKLMALLAMFSSAIAMYFCVRQFLRRDWAAVLAALVYLLHPQQIIRAAGAEHITICLFFPFIPLLWLTFARALETGKPREICVCAITAVFAMWTDNKQAVIQFSFLTFYLGYWFWPAERRRQWRSAARTLGLLAVIGIALGAVVVVPGLVESRYVKLFLGDPLPEWQKTYSFKSLFGLVDRNAVVTRDITQTAMSRLQTTQFTSQAQVDSVRRVFALQMDAPEKYMGLVALALLAVTSLWNYRREDRGLFWFFVGLLLLSLMLATGFDNVWAANFSTFDSLSKWARVPGAVWLALAAVIAFLTMFARKKLTSRKNWVIAGVALAVFLVVPAFAIIGRLPYFKDVRAPYAFYDGPATFWIAMLAGFFVTDVIKSRPPLFVAGLAVLLLLDYWPYQKPMKQSDVPARTIRNLETAYGSLASDKEWVKSYSVTGRYFHLLGPIFSGKPEVYEAFYNWQAPLGLGLLQQAGGGSRQLLDMLAARFVLFDKTDPDNRGNQQILNAYRQTFPVEIENDDFVIFRNGTAHPYVSATAKVCLYSGELQPSARIALGLVGRDYTLVHDVPRDRLANVERTYSADSPPAPPLTPSGPLSLGDVQLTRERAGLIRIKLRAPQNCVAVIAESYYPFWRASVDGQPTDVLRVNCGLMGVQLTPGHHEILLRYEVPHSYPIAGMISALSLIGCALATIRSSGASRSPSLTAAASRLF
jgi:hypothetical protein